MIKLKYLGVILALFILVSCGNEEDTLKTEESIVEIELGPSAFSSQLVSRSNNCLSVPAGQTDNGVSLSQGACNDAADNATQSFEFYPVAGSSSSFYLENSSARRCVNVFGADKTSSADIIQWTCHGNDHQKFELVQVDAEAKSFNLVAEHSGLCLSTGFGKTIKQSTCDGGAAQSWQVPGYQASLDLTPPTEGAPHAPRVELGVLSASETYEGTLTGTRDRDYQPDGSYYRSEVSGVHKGRLQGPSSSNFDLYLYKWNSSQRRWEIVGRSYASGSVEAVDYEGTPGYYLWLVYSRQGSGDYVFDLLRAGEEPDPDPEPEPESPFESDKVTYLSSVSVGALGGSGSGNDIWGWTDAQTGKEYALVGTSSGTSFVDISNPRSPVVKGFLPTKTRSSNWRDIKVSQDHAYIVSEASGHGLQVFDLRRLRNASNGTRFSETAHYGGFGNAHNIAINEQSKRAYIVGATSGSYPNNCRGGLHIVDISNPSQPSFSGCDGSDGYVHDVQCVIYNGPDATHRGKEICFGANEDTITITDVTNPRSPQRLSRTGYSGARYTHQGWLDSNQSYLVFNDELDEERNGHNTRSYMLDVRNLDAPRLLGNFESSRDCIDHNNYIKGNYVYQANYSCGLRVLDISDVANGRLREVAYIDTHPEDDNGQARAQTAEVGPAIRKNVEAGHADSIFEGSWSVYPYYDSGVVAISDINRGLIVVKPQLP